MLYFSLQTFPKKQGGDMTRIQSWEVSDAFWKKVAPLIPAPRRDSNKIYKRKTGGGRKPIPPRKVFEAIMYVLRTGCQWKALPKERFGSPSAIHTHFLCWMEAGFFVSLWRKGLAEYDEMEGIAWRWQSIDGALMKQCADDRGCGWLFLDTSRNQSRRWCSMKSCGNRAKVRRHRSRLTED